MLAIPKSFYDIIEGLVYYSETDCGYVIEPLESKSLAKMSNEIATQHNVSEEVVKRIDPEVFFQHAMDAADRNDALLVKNAKKTAALHQFLKQNLTDLMVYRIESGVKIPIYIVGAIQDGSFIAIKTISVET